MENKRILVFSILFFVALINYWRVPFLFWQQDEWVTFANLITSGISITLHGLDIKSTHFSPITNFLTFICFKVFGFQPLGYLIIGLFIHLINGFIVYKIAQKLIPNFLYALLAGSLFIISSAPYQLLMWPMISINSISLTFTLLAILVLINFIFKRVNPFFWGFIMTFLLSLSLFTIEYSAGILLFAPISLLFFHKKIGKGKIIRFLVPLLLFTLFYIWFRLYFTTPLNTLTLSSKGSQTVLVSHALTYPFYYLGQIYLPENIIVQLSKKIADKKNTNENVYPLKLTFILSFFILFLAFYTLKKIGIEKYSSTYKIILLIFIFIALSSLPFVLLAGDFTIFPSRYLYFGTAGSALILSVLLYYSKTKKNFYIFIALPIIVASFIVFSTVQNLQKSKDLYKQGQLRKLILEDIQSRYPTLLDKSIFYFESDTAYYGLPSKDQILPFQGGLGQILLIWYSKEKYFPAKFYQNQFLWEITEENYIEVEGVGYGYFRNFDKLQKVISSYNLPPESVIAFSWKGDTNTLIDITKDIRKRLSN